jgi:hypothetical protein
VCIRRNNRNIGWIWTERMRVSKFVFYGET